MNTLMELKKQLLGPLEVRKTGAQKDAFIRFAEGWAKKCGLEMRVEETGKLVRTRNLVFGDVDHAKTLLTAHYDTCARLPFPNIMTPMNWPVIILTQFILIPALFLLIGIGGGALVHHLLAGLSPFVNVPFSLLAGAASMLALAALMLIGPANPHTANDNTSGVVFILMAMQAFGGREDAAFVLFDNEEKGLLGSKAFVSAHPAAARTFLVQYDCISDGKTMLYTGSPSGMKSPQGRRMEAALRSCAGDYRVETGAFPQVLYPSDQMLFQKGTAFAALQGKRLLYLGKIHTARDTVFEEENLLRLLETLEVYFRQEA